MTSLRKKPDPPVGYSTPDNASASVDEFRPERCAPKRKTDRLQALPMHEGPVRAHLDQLRWGMVFCDAHARVHWLNGSAQRLLADGALRLVGSRLVGSSEDDTGKLMQELAQADAAAADVVRYLRIGKGERTLHVAIQAADEPSAIVLVLTSASQVADIPADALIRLFGLTPSEARLASALADGSTLEKYAQRHGLSVGTVRVHLKHAQSKTGARRQSELVRLVLSSAAAHLLPRAADTAESSRHPDLSS